MGGFALQHGTRAPVAGVKHGQLQCIQGVFHHQAQLGVALHDQAAVEEQGVRVLAALGQQQKVLRVGANGQVGLGVGLAGGKALAVPGEIKAQPRIAHADADALAVQEGLHIVR